MQMSDPGTGNAAHVATFATPAVASASTALCHVKKTSDPSFHSSTSLRFREIGYASSVDTTTSKAVRDATAAAVARTSRGNGEVALIEVVVWLRCDMLRP